MRTKRKTFPAALNNKTKRFPPRKGAVTVAMNLFR